MTAGSAHPAPHDALFKRVFGDVAGATALLRSILPPTIGARVDWSSVTLRSGSYVDVELQGLTSDLVFSAKIGERDAFFYLLVEHQSSPDPTMAWRLWRYVTRLWEREVETRDGSLRLPFVVPIVVYHGQRPWSAAESIDSLLDVDPGTRADATELLPRFRYLVDDLTTLDATGLRDRGLPAFATLALWALRTASDRGFVETASALADLFEELRATDGGGEALRTLFSYLSLVSRTDEDLVGRVLGKLSPPVREDIMNLIEMFAEQKRNEGREEGREEGRRAVLLKQLALRFGAVPELDRERVRGASAEQLDRWAERVLSGATLHDVLTD